MTQQLASTLAAIHALPPGIVPAGIGASEGGAVAMPHWWRDTPEDPEAGDARARFAALPAVPLDARCLLHGDFWPGNVLFDEGRLVAVIDWEDALIGDPLQDLAIARLDLTWSSGLDARDAFTAAYARITGHPLATLAAWDLYAALRAAPGLEIWAEGYPAFGRDDITAPLMRTAVSASIHDSLRRLGA
jgi:aminoglycoside phosphotransferase (APT) family kinase protein